jgi:proteic killer suppression protein
VIVSFGDSLTERLFHEERPRHFPPDVVAAAHRKLDMLDSATTLSDLAAFPGNRLEALHGDLDGWHSIRINAQWRLVFLWRDGDAASVRVTDYH